MQGEGTGIWGGAESCVRFSRKEVKKRNDAKD